MPFYIACIKICKLHFVSGDLEINVFRVVKRNSTTKVNLEM